MRITGTGNPGNILPAGAAKAYGVKSPFAAQSLAKAPAAAPASPSLGPNQQRPDAYEPSQNVQSLVAGKVTQPANFDAVVASAGATPAGPVPARVLQMYARAADRVEAAIGVHIGRAVDLRG